MKKMFIALAIAVLTSLYAHAFTQNLEYAAGIITDDDFARNPQAALELSETASLALKPQNIFVYMTESVKSILSGSYKELSLMLAVIILAAVLQIFSSNLGSLYGITEYVSLLSLMLICFNMITPLLLSVTDFLEHHTAFMTSVTATSSALLSASGMPGSSAASSVSASFITAFTQLCAVNIVLPAVKVIIVLSSVGAISKWMNISGVTGFLKSFCSYGIGLLFAVFLGVHSLTLSISASADSIAFRSLRFTAARLIPVAGGMISESIKTVLAGMSLIKNTAGGIGIAYIIYTAIPAITSVLTFKLSVIIAIAVSKLFGTGRHTAFLEGLNGASNLIFAICIFASFGGIIILAVFMKINTAL